MKNIILLMITLLAGLLTRCSSGQEKSNELLNGTWALDIIVGEIFNQDSGNGQRPVIEIKMKERRFSGNTGCNNMNGIVTMEGSKITFSDIVTTKMYCMESIEQEFLIALGKINNYKIEKMRLFLFEDETEMMILKKID
jgi:heat shock protein HslJ